MTPPARSWVVAEPGSPSAGSRGPLCRRQNRTLANTTRHGPGKALVAASEHAYPLATSADLTRTVAEVEALGRRIVATEADVRDAAALGAAVASGVGRLGSVDIVVANAGIGMMLCRSKIGFCL
jgi:NAD(P)-dependent dehydrogenase (short-subunit alcohol dehydrogenase family)